METGCSSKLFGPRRYRQEALPHGSNPEDIERRLLLTVRTQQMETGCSSTRFGPRIQRQESPPIRTQQI